MEISSGVNKRETPLEGGNSSCAHYGNTLENVGNPLTSTLDTPRNLMQAGYNRNGHNVEKNWGVLTADERRINVLAGRKNGMSWRDIAVTVGLKRHNQSTVYRWAIRNLPELKEEESFRTEELFPEVNQADSGSLPVNDVPEEDLRQVLTNQIKETEQTLKGYMEKIVGGASQEVLTDQKIVSEVTEELLVESLRKLFARVGTGVIPVARTVSPIDVPPPPPKEQLVTDQKPPETTGNQPQLIDWNTVDYKALSREDIEGIPKETLEDLPGEVRKQLIERMRKLRRLEEMSPEERAEYLAREKTKSELTEASQTKAQELIENDLFNQARIHAEKWTDTARGRWGEWDRPFEVWFCLKCRRKFRSEEASKPTKCGSCGANKIVEWSPAFDPVYDDNNVM